MNIDGNIGWQILLVLNFLLGVAGTVVGLMRGNRRSIEPSPLEVRESPAYVPQQVFETTISELKEEQNRIFAKMGGMERGIREEVRRDVEKLHDKVNEVAVQVGGLSASFELLNQNLARISAKLDVISERKIT